MIVKDKKIVVGIITCLMLISSISVLAPVIVHYTNSYSKNTILLTAANNYNTRKLSSNKYSESPNTLINNLAYINKYINSTLIVKEKLLKLSILGGTYDNTSKYKNDKKKKRSELAQFSHTLKHVHRYGDQVRATIDNSTNSLTEESRIISQIIPIIRDHPYTYAYHLNKMNVSIPNISFFINNNNNNLSNSNNLNSKTSNISNSSYGIHINNTNLNSIAFSSEEDGVNAQTMYSAGSSIYAAAFKKITFQAQIITFDKTLNSFKYETQTAKENTSSKISKKTELYSENSEITNSNSVKTNNSSYFKLSRTVSSDLDSLNNSPLPTPLETTYLPNYFRKDILNVAEARVKYNQISSFRNNESIYIPAIVFGPGLITAIYASALIVIAHIAIGVGTKKQQSLNKDKMAERLENIDWKVKQNNIVQKVEPEDFNDFIHEMGSTFHSLKADTLKIPLKMTERSRISDRIASAERIYFANTRTRWQELNHGRSYVNSIHSTKSATIQQAQNTNSTAIENMINGYTEHINDINGTLDGIHTLEPLNTEANKIIQPFQAAFTMLNTNPNHVNVDDSSVFMVQLQGIISQLNDKLQARMSAIREGEEAATQKRIDDGIQMRQTNKKNAEIAIEAQQTEIDALGYIDNEEVLNTEAGKIHNTLSATVRYVKDKEYSSTDIANVLNQQAGVLQDSLDTKLNTVKRRIRETNRENAEATINDHKEQINKLGELDNETTLQKTAKQLSDEIPEIIQLVNDGLYNDDLVSQQLKDSAIFLEQMLTIKVNDVTKTIQNDTLLRNAIQNINNELTAVEDRLKTEPDKLLNIKTTEDFVQSVEDQITPIVHAAKTNSKIIGIDTLAQMDTRVNDLRINNKQVYDAKRKEFKKQDDDMKIAMTTDLTQKQAELTECKYIVDNRKTQGLDSKELSDSQIEISRIKITGLESDIKNLKLELAEKTSAEIQAAKFKFPEGILNILDV